ncbi:type II toxin-antitoxin system RelE family toxin [Pseudarthrobacter sp. TAF60_1]|uniref:type II toxin-antitoxin system RelE family toxin n=1 Tax=Pseudarthrobacter sp. TAF60_1 TaxID=3233071 RepID=UPI003F9A24C1
MTDYTVEFTAGAAKELRKLEITTRRRILVSIAGLAIEPRPAGCKKLVGEQNAWRIRIADYRVLYEIHDEVLTVTIFRVAHRREVYKR